MAKSSLPTAGKSGVSSKSVTAKRATAKRPPKVVAEPVVPDSPEEPRAVFSDIEDAFCNLADSFRGYQCLQSFLSPRFRLMDVEEFQIEPDELRGLVTVLNSEMARQLQALKAVIEEVRGPWIQQLKSD